MKRDNFTLPIGFANELIIDNFAGGGGTSTGLEAAFGRPVDIAINHDPEALAMHAVNHPHTLHLCESVWDVDPIEVTRNQPVGLVWLSPDCKHFSKAKGGTPVEKKIRGLAWVALRWAAKCKPRVIMLENVEEFRTWGPLQIAADGTARPDPSRKGKTFESFVRQLQGQGYTVDWRELRACDFGTPTIRKRFFLVARRDGIVIEWPKPTHGAPSLAGVKAGKLLPWRTAAECIDWSIPCPSIFERRKPLADATLRRVAKGVMRYVVNAAKPFIVPIAHFNGLNPAHDINDPVQTETASLKGGAFALAMPTLVSTEARLDMQNCVKPLGEKADEHDCASHRRAAGRNDGTSGSGPDQVPGSGAGEHGADGVPPAPDNQTEQSGRIGRGLHTCGLDTAGGNECLAEGVSEPQSHESGQRTAHHLTAGHGEFALAAPTLVQTGYGERAGQAPRALDIEAPLGTVVSGQKHALVSAFLAKHYTGVVGSDLADPISTITACDHHSLVTAHITKFQTGSVGHAADEPLHTVTASSFVKRPGGSAPLGIVAANLVHLGHGEQSANGARPWSHGVRDVAEPLNTVTASGAPAAVVTSNLVKLRGTSTAQASDEPLHTISAQGTHFSEVRAFLVKYYGTDQDPKLAEPLHTITTKDRFGLVTVHGEEYAIVDIGLRMLSPRELYNAQGFPASYRIDADASGKSFTKTAQVRMCGNSVCPPMAEALIRANFAHEAQIYGRAA